jgi:uncharacterized protein
MAMTVGACSIELRIHGAGSLKDKRSVLKPILNRLRREFGVSAAEVDLGDAWGASIIGLAIVSNDSRHAHAVLEKCIDWLERERLDVDLVAYDIEML